MTRRAVDILNEFFELIMYLRVSFEERGWYRSRHRLDEGRVFREEGIEKVIFQPHADLELEAFFQSRGEAATVDAADDANHAEDEEAELEELRQLQMVQDWAHANLFLHVPELASVPVSRWGWQWQRGGARSPLPLLPAYGLLLRAVVARVLWAAES